MCCAASFCATVTRASPPESPVPAATEFVSAAAWVGVSLADTAGPRFNDTAAPFVFSVAGGMTLETSLSIAA